MAIDKKQNQNTAHKIQLYNNWLVDDLVKKHNEGEVNSRPTSAVIWAELSILNKPEVYRNYNRIINSKYTSNDAIFNLLIKNKANDNLNYIVESELERINKNLDYVNEVLNKYDIPQQQYEALLKKQEKQSLAHRQKVLKEIAIKANDLLVSEGLNIPSNLFNYREVKGTAESLLRQSQMQSKHEQIRSINENYLNQGKDKVYNGKEWVWTGKGRTTRHRSNHLQKRFLEEDFIIVNDKTLHIDEMKYPCDPRGSFSNAFICYCEVEYLTDYTDPYADTVPLKQTNYKPATPIKNMLNNPPYYKPVKFASKLNHIPQQMKIGSPAGINIFDYNLINSDILTPTYIDTSDLYFGEYSQKYLFNSFELDEFNGEYYYHGLKIEDYDEIDGMGYITAESIAEHNKQFQSEEVINDIIIQGDIIDLNDIEYMFFEDKGEKGEYWLDENDGAYINSEGKWEYKGLIADVKDYGSFGKWSYDSIINHNEQIKNNPPIINTTPHPTDIKPIDKEKLDWQGFGIDAYIVDSDIIYNPQTNEMEYHGLPIHDYDEDVNIGYLYEEDIIEHNKQIMSDLLTDDIDDFYYDKNTYSIGIDISQASKNNEGLWTFNGIEAKVVANGKVWIDVDDIFYNRKSEDKVENTPSYTKINTSELGYDENDDMYIIYDFELDIVDGKAMLEDLNVSEYYNDSEDTYNVPKSVIEEYNRTGKQPLKAEGEYVRNSNLIKRVKDENDEVYAVDTDGSKYHLDINHKGEEKQDELQMKIDMSEHKQGMYGWAVPDYDELNDLLLGKDRYEDYVDIMHEKILPLLDEIYRLTDEGKSINHLLDDYEKVAKEAYEMYDNRDVYDYLWEYVDIEQALAKSPPLHENTMFIRDGYWNDAWNVIGEIFEFEPYSSTTYREEGAGFDSSQKYRMIILAPKGTRGTRMNNQYDSITSEREWLLKRHQKFEVIEFNDHEVYDSDYQQRYRGTVVIRLIP